MKILPSFWTSEESSLFLNPRLPKPLQDSLELEVHKIQLPGTLWLQSSGTESSSSGTKIVAIHKNAFLAGAQGCVDFYKINQSDIWFNPLPLFHVGGLAIEARCLLSGAKSEIYQGAWSAHSFEEQIRKVQATWTSLVPTQVYDLVQASIRAPLSLQAVLVGGGALSAILWQQAKNLGWPLLPSYGMTETSALIAGARLESLEHQAFLPKMELLPHVRLEQVENEKYLIRTRALFSGYLLKSELENPMWRPRPEPFVLDDRLVLEENKLTVLGRDSELVKILGETVNLTELTLSLSSVIPFPLAVVSTPHERKGYDLHLFVEGAREGQVCLDELNGNLLPYQRIVKIHSVKTLPRTVLGKIKTTELLRLLEQRAADGFQES